LPNGTQQEIKETHDPIDQVIGPWQKEFGANAALFDGEKQLTGENRVCDITSDKLSLRFAYTFKLLDGTTSSQFLSLDTTLDTVIKGLEGDFDENSVRLFYDALEVLPSDTLRTIGGPRHGEFEIRPKVPALKPSESS
jgi:hypothetical protein